MSILKKMIVTIGALTTISTAAAFENTYLLAISQGSALSDRAHSMSLTKYESAYGDVISFEKKYKPKFVDTRIEFVSMVNRDFGITWGFSTGEKGEKYSIEPSFKLGAIYAHHFSKTATLTLKGSYTFGGMLKEKTCSADYGEIGGIRTVNCRLAATTLQPEETLQYLINQKPNDYKHISIQFKYEF